MASTLQPPPRRFQPLDPRSGQFSRAWDQWFQQLSTLLDSGIVPWTAIDFTGSDHNDISTIQGGDTSERYHLTAAEHAQAAYSVTSIAADATLTDAQHCVLVTASGCEITLPAASADRVGGTWTVALGVPGWTEISAAGSDVILLDGASDSITLDQRGTSVSLRCVTATSWVIV